MSLHEKTSISMKQLKSTGKHTRYGCESVLYSRIKGCNGDDEIFLVATQTGTLFNTGNYFIQLEFQVEISLLLLLLDMCVYVSVFV